MKRITRTSDVSDFAELLDDPPRAYVAFVVDGAVDAAPAGCRYRDGAWFVRLPDSVGLAAGADVSLLVDEGRYYFELRGVRVRGTLGEATAGGWRELVASGVTGWDYGRLREREGG